MVATDLGEQAHLDQNNVFQINDRLNLLTSAAVYGANASGKSNLVKAIGFMRWFVIHSSSSTQVTDAIDVDSFRLYTETVGKPSFFEIVFNLQKRIYRYGFIVDRKQVIKEWLFHTPTSQERQLFKRDSDTYNISNKSFKEGNGLTSKTRKNTLFLSVVSQFNGNISQNILLWFAHLGVVSGIRSDMYREHTLQAIENKRDKQDILKIINKMDLGIDSIKIEEKEVSLDDFSDEIPESFRNMMMQSLIEKGAISVDIKTIHKQFDSKGNIVAKEEFDLDINESEGTKKLFALIGLIWEALKNGEPLIIDELDARLHPFITKFIIKLFNDKNTNPNNAQLVFMTHDTNLLNDNLLRKDQIWFVEKDQYSATDLYSLVEYDITKNTDFESDYIKGKYGAIPYLGIMTDLFANS